MERHNYLKTLATLIADGTIKTDPPTDYRVEVRHDGWCQVYKGGYCDCNPDMIVEERAS